MKPQLFVLFFLFISCSHFSQKTKLEGLSILQGLTSGHSIEFSVVDILEQDLTFKLNSSDGKTYSPSQVEWVKRPYGIHANIARVYFDQLATSEYFDLVVSKNGQAIEKRKVLPFNNAGEKLKFVVASCLNQSFSEKETMWQSIQSEKPEIIFLIGDNTYSPSAGDGATPEELAQSYFESRMKLPVYFWKELIPIHATWDDNDYGQNDGGENYQYKKEATEIFKLFFAQTRPSDTVDFGPGISSRLHLRGMHFAFLDNRSFRQKEKSANHFGIDQEAWLFNTLKTAELPTWIISGDQFFGGYHQFESYQGHHPDAFNLFKEQLQKTITPFILLSGDRHMSEVMQFPRSELGQLSFEITSSPLHSKMYPGQLSQFPNPWRVFGIDSEYNFLLINSELTNHSWEINLSFIGSNNKLLGKRELSLTTEPLKDFTIDKKIKRRKYRRSKIRRR